MAEDKILSLNHLGICIKSEDTTVEYQNSKCEDICGNQLGKKCDKGCILKLNSDHSEQVFKSGFKLYRNITIDNDKVESVIAQCGEKIITLLIRTPGIIQQQLDFFKKFKLSCAEMNILKKFLEGSKNSEIAKELFISKSTLRTHLNNIYKKLPAKFKKDILTWHFKK